jgi:hypothetical protein
MNTNAIRSAFGRTVHVPPQAKRRVQVQYATDTAVRKAHKRAIEKFANMFRKLAE